MEINLNALASYFYMMEYRDMDVLEANLPENAMNMSIDDYLQRAKWMHEAMEYLFENISEDDSEDDIMFHCYEAGKLTHGKSNLRNFFRDFYLITCHKEDGVRMGPFIKVVGVEYVRETIAKKFANPLDLPL